MHRSIAMGSYSLASRCDVYDVDLCGIVALRREENAIRRLSGLQTPDSPALLEVRRLTAAAVGTIQRSEPARRVAAGQREDYPASTGLGTELRHVSKPSSSW